MVTSMGRMNESPGKLHWVGGKVPAPPGDSVRVHPPWDCAWRWEQEAPRCTMVWHHIVLWHAAVFLGTLLLCLPRKKRFSPKTHRLGSGQRLERG